MKLSDLFLNIISMHVGLSGFLKHVRSFLKSHNFKISRNVFIGGSSMYELKSPSKIKLSYLDDSEHILSESDFRCDFIPLSLG